ncbi:ubiquitin-activating enzyme, putative, partial [Entamoeba invadens IP1]
TKFISGKIIPAMITTTAVVSGLQCIELYKILLKKPFSCYHNSFLNLAIGYLDSTEPEKVVTKKLCEGMEVTIWDKFEFNGNCTMQEFVDLIFKKFSVNVESVTVGVKMLYTSYLPTGKARLGKTIKEIYKELFGEDFKAEAMTLALTVTDKNGDDLPDDVEFPDVILTF